MKIHLSQIPEEGKQLSGEVSADILATEDFSPTGPMRYDIYAQVQDGGLLVRGSLEVEGTRPCARCLEPLTQKVIVPDFTLLIEIPQGECVDLTESAREDILLALPTYARCQLDAEGRCPVRGELWLLPDDGTPGPALGNPWGALDAVNLKGK